MRFALILDSAFFDPPTHFSQSFLSAAMHRQFDFQFIEEIFEKQFIRAERFFQIDNCARSDNLGFKSNLGGGYVELFESPLYRGVIGHRGGSTGIIRGRRAASILVSVHRLPAAA